MGSFSSSLFLLFFFFSSSLSNPQNTPLTLKGVDIERPVLEFSPSVLPGVSGSLGVKDALRCERVRVSGISRVKLGSYANSYHVTLAPSVSIPEKLHSKIQVCFHRNDTVGWCQCEKDEWRGVQKGVWNAVMSPYETRYVDVRINGEISGSVTVAIEEDFQQWRLVCLAVGLILLLLAPTVSRWVPFYYSTSMTIGIFLVIIILLFQGMKLMPTGRKNIFYLTIYGSVVGAGSFLLHQFSLILNSIFQSLGMSEEMHNPVAVFVILGIILAGAALGYWIVRRFVISKEDGSVDAGVAQFVKWAMRIIGTTFILQSTLDPLLAIGALITCGAACKLISAIKWLCGWAVPEYVQKEMMIIVSSLQEKLVKKSGSFEGVSSSFLSSEEGTVGSGSGDILKRKVRSQVTMNNMFKKNIREEASQDIALFFYNNAIPFNMANSEEYKKMFESVARHGPGFNPPSYHEIRVKYLKHHVEKTNLSLDDHRAYWKKSGCTIMTDGWTDRRRRTILNFLVNSPLGTVFLKSIDASNICKTADKIFKMMDDVVEEVGEENVVHIVTDNAANYKAAGDMLMQKRNKLYWTPCTAHCIDLMLEDFEKKIPLHKDTIASGRRITTYIYSRTSLIALLHTFTKGGDLIRSGLTRFATSYLTLGCLNENKGPLTRMFTSEEWTSGQLAKTKDGKFVENLITDKEFWKNVLHCMRSAFPLIKVLRLVDSDDKPAMGFIYEEMDRAKEKIQNVFRGVESNYMPIWEIIDQRWDNQLHRPLHAAGYYLNPMLHYSSGFKVDWEVKKGFIDCMERLVGDIDIMGKIDDQLEDFKKKRGLFGHAIAQRALQTKTPADWWDSYGDGHPELQKFAVRVLSLTCSSSGCERNWSMFEMVHTKKRNRLMQKTMNDVVFVMANSRLNKKREVRKAKIYTIEDISFDDDWIVEENDENDGLNPIEEDIFQVEDNVGNDGANVDDLDVPPIDEDDIVGLGIGDGVGDANVIVNVNDNEVDDNCQEELNALLND